MSAPAPRERRRIRVQGAVQGVGFRPFVYGLARRHGVSGFVQNDPQGVMLEIEGGRAALDAFRADLEAHPPPLARIQRIEAESCPPQGGGAFAIRHSAQEGGRTVLIAPDLATCADCLREMADPDDRRFCYPFINCTNCGPRYTIIRDMPYDRAMTTMDAFAMCPACRGEYEDPANRRFHAEPTCCPVCGPRLWMADAGGAEVACADPIAEAAAQLAAGAILAIKGLGGFHLACDAANPEAVDTLRRRKKRDVKPFAVMTRDAGAAAALSRFGAAEQAVLEAPERPIVLLDKRAGHGLAEAVAPRSAAFGVMLPYTPLHHLLLEGPFRALVMTSGNRSDEPIAHTNAGALEHLAGLADAFLLHDRAIHIRTDDSVVRAIAGAPRFLRRSRGYAPFPVGLPFDTAREVLAVGPELNNTICLTRQGQAFLSHHLGDLHNMPAYEGFLQAIGHLERVLDVAPEAVACDLHPGYLATRYARECGLPRIEVQHHHAHLASVLVEAGRTGPAIGALFDGLGWGDDDSLWGGEFLVGGLDGYEHAGGLEPVPQPGGDAAAKDAARMGYVYLRAAFGDGAESHCGALLPEFARTRLGLVAQLIERGVNCPQTTSMGRLFDAASALLGICTQNHFHAQAPMELEAAAEQASGETGYYDTEPIQRDGRWRVCGAEIIAQLVTDRLRGASTPTCAARFHNSVARATVEVCGRMRDNSGLNTVALSGGVFANAYLTRRVLDGLDTENFEPLLNAEAPPGDGGVSLGQAAVAAWRLQCA